MGINRKAINFDLSIKSLEKYFKDTREPYSLIKNFMLENGFEHRQYSGYTSKEPINERRVIRIVNKLTKKFTWLGECVKEFDITEIGEQYSLKETIQDLCAKELNAQQTKQAKDFHQKLKEFTEKTPKNQKLKD
ncbi:MULTISPECIES: virulence-associated protein VapD [Campylobacter]|uniref:virulence-associated protein VapD n=1 Tax=Campylobacter TaxID=194 RepID=UPI0012736239|nr:MULTISPECIES: virulence-associated protein VapD [Campylobacter]EAK1117656.1 vapd [Campylobacter coli]EAK3363911.1 vapd [Campylobacter jejuni]EAK6693782.1 vapd [Campylobacter coli]EAM0355674.1 vapd [Campylobacter coli]ECL3824618.1 vapd [Campylobacter jejuni]